MTQIRNNKSELERAFKSIRKTIFNAINDKKYYNIRDIRKKKRHIINQLSGKYSKFIARKVYSLLTKSLPKEAHNKRILGVLILESFIVQLQICIEDIFNYQNKQGDLKKIREKVRSESTEKDKSNATPRKTERSEKSIITICPSPGVRLPAVINAETWATPIGRVIPGSNTKVVQCQITEKFQEKTRINDKFVVFEPFQGVKVLGLLTGIHSENPTPKGLIISTMSADMSIQANKQLIRDVDARRGKIIVYIVKDEGRTKGKLGNAPPSGVDIFLATDEDMMDFHEFNADIPIKFNKTIGDHSFIPVFDLMRILRRHIYVVGITDSGKGYYVNGYLLACAGREITIGPGEKRKVAVIYIDFTGQFANDSYGFFKAYEDKIGEDPRVIINADQIGVQTPEDLVEIFMREYRILDLGFKTEKLSAIQRYLSERIQIESTLDDFRRELPLAIRATYQAGHANHIRKIQAHLNLLEIAFGTKKLNP